MTAHALTVSRHPPIPSPSEWQRILEMPGGGWPAVNMTSAYYNGNTYIGYVDPAGNVKVAGYDHATGSVTVSPAIVSGLTSDGHNAPSVLIRQSDHKILIAVSQHAAAAMYTAVSTNAEDVSSWGAATNIDSSIGGANYTYANLFQLSGESGKIYLFWRDSLTTVDGKLRFSTSTDGGATWAAYTELYAAPAGRSPYWTMDSDGVSRIDFAITDGEVSHSEAASLYHFYYTGGGYKQSDGTAISTSPPLGPSDLTLIFDGSTVGAGVTTAFSIAASGPTVGFTAGDSYPSNPSLYKYAVWSGGSWSVNAIDDNGAVVFPQGGIAVSRTDPSTVFAQQQQSGQTNIVRFTTGDGGTTWSPKQLTFDTDQPNIGPIVPRDENSGMRCLWHYGPESPLGTTPGFTVQVRGYPNRRQPF